MSNWTDARILHGIWASHFDPDHSSLNYACNAAQEAWLLVAAAARLLPTAPEETSHVKPGHLYIVKYPERESWKGAAPRQPVIGFSLNNIPYLIQEHEGEVPAFIRIDGSPVFHTIPGLIHVDKPIGD